MASSLGVRNSGPGEAIPLQYAFAGTIRRVDDGYYLDCQEYGSMPLVTVEGMRLVLGQTTIPEDTDLSGEVASIVVTLPNVQWRPV